MRANLCDLIPDPDNVRTHSEANIRAIEGSLKAFGQRKPIVVVANGDDTYTVVAGNGTLQAATNLGWDALDIAPIPDGWTSDTIRAYAIADNKTAELAAWDTVELNAQLEELTLSGFDIGDIGFDIDDVFSTEPIEDDVPEPPKDPITKLGDLWRLGEHRLLCGDSTDADSVGMVMNGQTASALITDPPYGVDYEGGQNAKKREKIAGDDTDDIYGKFLSEWVSMLSPKAATYIWFAGGKGSAVYSAVEGAGLTVRALIIWNKLKPHYGAFMAQYMNKHEPCLYCVQKGGTEWYGPTNEVTVWDIDQPSKNEHHPTQKPIETMARAARNSTKRGDIIVDPFLGSGTTLIACEQLGRVCYGMELDPAYCDVIVQRWENLTGKKATREGE